MAASTPTRRLFCRRLFRLGGATPALRHAWLDELSDSAALQQQGGAVVSTSANGASVSFQLPPNWNPDDANALIEDAYTWAEASDIAAALALLPDGPVTSYGHDFTTANASGGAL